MLGNGPRLRAAKSTLVIMTGVLLAACNVVTPRPVEGPLGVLYPSVDFPFEDPPRPPVRPANVPPLPAPPQEEAAEPEEGPFDFVGLVGSDEPAVAEVLGEPNWFEDIPPARMWQYASANCVLQLYFFMELSTRNFRVLSYELESGYDGDNAEQQCFSELVSRAGAGTS